MALAVLSIDLEARLAKFEAGMDRAGRLLQKLSVDASNTSKRVGEVFAGSFLANAATESLSRLVQFFPRVLDGVLAIKDLSEATGASIENISALDDIARKAGATLGDVEGVLIKFNAALKDADGKNGISLALKAIGLDAAALRKEDPAEALRQAAVALDGFADDGNRARLTQELFGKGVKNAATFLRELAEVQKLQGSVTKEQTEEADKFAKTISAAKANVEDFARSLGGPVITAINNFVKEMKNARESYGSVTAGVIDSFDLTRGGTLNQQLTDAAQKIAALNTLIESNRAAGKPELLNAGLKEEVALLEKRSKFLGLQLNDLGGGRGNINRGFGDTAKPKLPFIGSPDKLKEAKTSFEDYSQTLTQQIAALINKTDTVRLAEIALQFERLNELAAAGLDPKIVEQVRRMLSPPLGPNAGPQLSEQMERVNALLQQTDSAKLAQASRDAKLLSDELSRTTVGTQRWRELQDALLDVETTVTELSGTFPAFIEQIDEAAEATRDAIEGTIGSSFRAALEGNFKSIGEMWKNLIIDMAAQALAANLADSLFGQRGANGARQGGGWVDLAIKWFSTASANANGNAFDRGGVTRFADGGIVNQATPFSFGGGRLGVMGEAGPEAVVPLKRGKNGKLGIPGGGAQVTVNNNLTVSGDPNPQTMVAMQAMLSRSNAQLVRGMKTGTVGA